MSSAGFERLKSCLARIREHTDFRPALALVLGSGLGEFAGEIEIYSTMPYEDLPGFPTSTIPGHAGRFVFGFVGPVPVVIMQGRVHYYEGYGMDEVVLPIRLMGQMGAEVLVLTNAVGGLNADYSPGELMLIRDQIASFVPSPLVGPNLEELGPRFPDMTEIYDGTLREIVKGTAAGLGLRLKEGVYLQTTGPNFESPAEIRMYRTLGADVVGMSTACEAIAARHAGMKVCGISCISNMAAGMGSGVLSHEEVIEASGKAAGTFKALLRAAIPRMYGGK